MVKSVGSLRLRSWCRFCFMAPTLLAHLPAWTERLANKAESGYAWPPGWAVVGS